MTEETTYIMPDNPELIMLGQEAQDFVSSTFGQYMLDRAAKKAGDAARALCIVEPTDTKRIIQLQYEAKVLTILNDFVNECVNAAKNEYANYQQKLTDDQ